MSSQGGVLILSFGDIAERLLLLRTKILNCSQSALAEAIGYSDAHVANVEKGKSAPSDAYLKAVASTFKISEKWLRTGEGPVEIDPLLDMHKLLDRVGNQRLAEALSIFLKNAPNVFAVLPPPPDPIEDVRLRQMVSYLREIWREADDEMKGWIVVQFRNAFPGFISSVEKKRAMAGEGPDAGA